VVGLAAAFGSGAMTNSIPELADAKCIFIIGSNTTENHPIAAKWIMRGREKGAKIIVVDPRATQMAFLADIAVQHRLGTDVALINGLMHIIIKEGWHDKAYVEERTEGFEALAAKLEDYPPDKVAQITGIDVATLRRMAEMFAKNKPASIVYCMGITQHTTGVDNVKDLANLAMLTGNVGVASGGVNPLRGQNNVQGACDMGGLPNVFTGYQPVADEAANKKFSEAWGRPLSNKPGLTILDMFHAIEEGKIKALYVIGENPLVTDPDLRHVEAALKHLDVFIVQDIFLTQTAKNATIVLPGTSFAEKDGTFSNTERRVLLVRQAIPPVGESRPDWMITQDLSTRVGYPMHYDSPEAIFEEMKSLTPSYAGMTYARLAGNGLQWPCPTAEHPGTVFLHKDRFSRGKGAFTAIDYKPPAEVGARLPNVLHQQSFAHYHSGSMTRVSPTLHQEVPEGYIEISPVDAKSMAIKDGERVKVSSRRGEIQIKARISGKVNRGVVFIPFHFAETAANVLTNSAYDPVAKIPEYKVCAVKVEKLAATAIKCGLCRGGLACLALLLVKEECLKAFSSFNGDFPDE
jgi:formate dehydrogenase alpha subunit